MSDPVSQTLFERAPAPRARLLLFGLAALYMLLHFGWYSTTPPGLAPVLDGKENITIAGDIARGELESGPFYRAMLYPALLSLGAGAGEAWLPLLARALNGIAHLFAMAAVFFIARRLWRSEPAGLLAAALYGFYPVALFFAADPLDVTLAAALALWGMVFAIRTVDTGRTRDALAAGALMGLAVLARPHFLPVAIAVPAVMLLLRARAAMPAAAATLALCALAGLANLVHSGAFVMLPTQGAFNLWAANRDGANGRWFQQSIEIDATGAHRNPARVEAEQLFARATGLPMPQPQSVMNAYWRERIMREVAADPARWVGLMLRKTWYLLNHDEAYNNKTYAFHKALAPWLRFNPLGWSLLLALATAALIAGRHRIDRRAATLIAVAALAYAAGLLLYYVSARFRLPLAPFLAIAAGGALACADLVRQRAWSRFAMPAAIAAAVAALSLTPAFGIRSVDTTIEDRLLLAQASLETGDDAQALHRAREVIGRQPDRHAANEVAVVASFNLLLLDAQADPTAVANEWIQLARVAAGRSRPAAFIAGVHEWTLGEREQARARWSALAAGEDAPARNALRALMLVAGNPPPADDPLAQRLAQILSH